MTEEKRKPVIYSHWQIVFPSMANTHGVMFGGKILEIMDMEAGVAASLYCQSAVATVSIEQVDFLQPVYVGNRLETQARVVLTAGSSVVVYLECYAEDHLAGTRRFCASAYFNMISLNKEGKPQNVPPLLVESNEEQNTFHKAKHIFDSAVQRRKQFKNN